MYAADEDIDLVVGAFLEVAEQGIKSFKQNKSTIYIDGKRNRGDALWHYLLLEELMIRLSSITTNMN